jgi:hypothetical protein
VREPQNTNEFITWLNDKIAWLEKHAEANDLDALCYLEVWSDAHAWATEYLSTQDAELLEPEPKPYMGVPGWAAIHKLKRLRDRLTGERSEKLAPRNQGGAGQAEGTSSAAPARKRSTERGEGRAKLIAALTKHHQYADGGCLNLEPIGNNELAKAAGVWPSTASAFFNEKFQGHAKYKALCRDSGQLVIALKLLNNEFSPHDLYGRRPAVEDDRDDEGDE